MDPSKLAVLSSEYPDQVLAAGKITFGEEGRRRLQKAKRQEQHDRIIMAAVALLNSGGGIISAEIENHEYSYAKNGIGQDLESTLKDLVNPSTIEDYFEFLQKGAILQVFVKSWNSVGHRPRLCCVDTGLRERSGSSTSTIESNALEKFLWKKTLAQCREEGPAPKRRRMISGNNGIKKSAQELYARQEVQLGEVLSFGESVNVELKQFGSENMIKRLEEIVPKYVSAFANTDGGYMFIGVDDKTKKVVGCGRNLDCSLIETKIGKMWRKVILVHTSQCTQENDWSVEVRILKVLEEGATSQLHVVAIHIPVFCCAIFENHPESWEIENDKVCPIKAGVWLEKMHLTDPDKELCSQFDNILSLGAAPPRCKPVYGIKDAHLSELQQNLFPVHPEIITTGPDPLKERLFQKYPKLENLVKLQSGGGTLIFSNSWAVDINRPGNQEVLCEALLVSEQSTPSLYCVVKNESQALREYSRDVAFHLKQQLVNLGGYLEWVCIIPQLVDCETGKPILTKWGSLESMPEPRYPDCYKLSNMKTVKALLQALVIVVMSFTSALSSMLGSEFLNLLTAEQFCIIQEKYDFEDMRELFVHGYPGAGKTVIATLLMRRIKNKLGCETSNILYICENVPLKKFIENLNICQSVTRKTFMRWNFPEVKHVIVDEAQNFRREDGDWYKKAKDMVEQQRGVFWVFLDYFQQSHSLPSGLPLPSKQPNKIILRESLRNSVAIHSAVCEVLNRIREAEFTRAQGEEIQKHLEKMTREKHCMHAFQGYFEERSVAPQYVHSELISTVKRLLSKGNSPNDIAVLCSTLEEVPKICTEFGDKLKHYPCTAETIDGNVIVVDSVRRFSGLERNIIILINPSIHPFHQNRAFHFLVSAMSRARTQLYVLCVQADGAKGNSSHKRRES
ncbi:schlafen family member 9-like [Scleropages formosus]|uniref:Schlafen family member 5 n=1 Tax=Scleropages formosus TaxID=113540 RepID=A0A8C9V356_SCLFO|nr:schlafen family member 9-like [Scleropages formosus]